MHRDYSPMNAAGLMDRVFDLYKDTFKFQIAFSLIIGIISTILIMVLGIALALGIASIVYGMIATGAYSEFYDRYIIAAVIFTLLAILPLYLGWLYLSASGHILISKQAFYGERIELPIFDTFRAFFRVMSAAMAQLLLSVPWFILLAIVIYNAVAGYTDIFEFIVGIHPLVLALSTLAYVLIYVIYSNIFALSVPVAIFEKRLFFATVARSFQLIKEDFWKVLGIRILWVVLVYLISYSAQGLLLAIIAAIAFLAGNVADIGALWFAAEILQFYISLFSLFIGIIIGPMEGIMTALIYFNQKIKKDGLDIEVGIQRLIRGSNP